MRIFFLEFFFKTINFTKRKIFFYERGGLDNLNVEIILNPQNFKNYNLKLPKEYNLREFTEKDFYGFHMLMLKVNMGFCPLSYWKNYIIPGGFLVVEKVKTKKIVGAAFIAIYPNSKYDEIGTLEWLASDPDLVGLGIGPIIASSLSKRLVEENFKKIRLGTQKHRKAVISMYKKLGWQLAEDL